MERPPPGRVEDLATLAKLDEKVLLNELKTRYNNNDIYTYVGDILIAVNPFRDLGIYEHEESMRYDLAKKSDNPPHIFAVADSAFQNMIGYGGRIPTNQCILISGESGAGKTESTKLIIKQLVELCRGNTQLEQQILQVNPLLEAFGNAQTNMNDNSSRFGKYIQLMFHNGHVMGAKISEYLLEKSRLVHQSEGEESFHIFYYMFVGLSTEYQRHYGLHAPDKFRYLANGMTGLSKDKTLLKKNYEQLVNALDLVGFTDEEQNDMFTMVASVLHLGNVTFEEDDNDAAFIQDMAPIDLVARLLNIDSQDLAGTLTSIVTITRGEHVKRHYNKQQAEDARDAIPKILYGHLFCRIVNKINQLLVQLEAVPVDQQQEICILDIQNVYSLIMQKQIKYTLIRLLLQEWSDQDARDAVTKILYGRLFGWIVNKINQLLAPLEAVPVNQQQEIGILDIFGFETFEKNSFEQACINLANEQLQFFFNQHVFKQEQEEYSKEGIDWKEIKFVDNQPLLDLFLAKPIGILSVLDEESSFPRATEASLVAKFNLNFSKNPYYKAMQGSQINRFTINHYAGQVTYDGYGWLEKNRDTLPPGLMEMLQASKNDLIKAIFKAQVTRTGSLAFQARKSTRKTRKGYRPSLEAARKRKQTVGGQFKNSLQVLMDRMTAASPIFVRCLKPNHLKAPGTFREDYIQQQLLYTGMLETTKIRREGFAVRPTFAEFVNKYKVILCQPRLAETKENCVKILAATKIQGWQVGKTKVFLKYYHLDQLGDVLKQMGKSAIVLQRIARGFLGRRKAGRLWEVARQQAEKLQGLLSEIQGLSIKMAAQQEAIAKSDKDIPPTFFGRQDRASVMSVAPPPVPGFNYQDVSGAVSVTSADKRDYLQPKPNRFAEAGTQADYSDSDSDFTDDEFVPVSSHTHPGHKEASVQWFQETQAPQIFDPTKQNFIAEWFHGVISRRQSEELLKRKQKGTYLIRVSESRFGYTLSFKAEDRVRHYMIDQLRNKKFIIVGECKVHKTLKDIIEYHQNNKISNWEGYLIDPCGQESGECDYGELVNERFYFTLEEQMKRMRASNVSGLSRASNVPDTSRMSGAPDSSHRRHPGAMWDKSGTKGPPVPDRNYSVAKGFPNASIQRPLPKRPDEAYQRLIENQQNQHGYGAKK